MDDRTRSSAVLPFVVSATLLAGIACDSGTSTISPDLRVVHGSVPTTSPIFDGDGFTSGHQGTGGYGVVFDEPFAEAPTVVVTAVEDLSEQSLVVSLKDVTTTGFDVRIANTEYPQSATDAEFHFIAMGTR